MLRRNLVLMYALLMLLVSAPLQVMGAAADDGQEPVLKLEGQVSEGIIVDFDDSRFLVKKSSGALVLHSRTDGAETTIYEGSAPSSSEHLTEAGAVFAASEGYNQSKIYLWKNKALTAIGPSTGINVLKEVNKRYAVYTSSDMVRPHIGFLGVLDLRDGSLLRSLYSSSSNELSYMTTALAENNRIFFSRDRLFRYEPGSTDITDITKKIDGQLMYVNKFVTDGEQVVFDRGGTVYLDNGTELQPITDRSAAVSESRVRSGWVAFLKKDSGGAAQLFLRSADGAVNQITPSGEKTVQRILALQADGTVLFVQNDEVWAYQPAKGPELIRLNVTSSEIGKVVERNGSLYALKDNALYHIGLSPRVPDDTELPFWPETSQLEAQSISASTVVLQWGSAADNTGVASYRIYRDGEPAGTTGGNAYQFEAKNLKAETTYEFSIEAVDFAGNRTAAKRLVTVTTTTEVPGLDVTIPVWTSETPVSVTQVTYSSAKVEWIPAQDDRGVAVYHLTLSSAYEEVSVSSTVYGYEFTGLQPSTEYTLGITAADAAGNLSEPVWVTIATEPEPTPVPAASMALKVKSGVVSVNSTVTVTLKAEQVSDLYAFLAKLQYDTTLLQLTQVSLHQEFGVQNSTAVLGQHSPAAGQLKVSGSLLGDVYGRSGASNLVSFKFKALKNGQAGITLLPGTTFVNSAGAAIAAAQEPITVNVTIGGGDFDQDGDIDLQDLVLISRAHGTQAGGNGFDPRYDLNSDGQVDQVDVNVVLNKITKTQ